ncbi:MAG TPA: flagellar basal body-associated FliL family protein [Polyangiaceae bacterium]
MSEEKTESTEAKPEAAKPAKGGGVSPVMLVLTAALSAGGAFGGAKIAAAHQAPPVQQIEVVKVPQKKPGPTMNLLPFLVMTKDEAGKEHPIKLTMAVEFEATTKEEELKELTPRVRDAVLTFLRAASFDDLTNQKLSEKTRADLLEKLHTAGCGEAEHILITDFVVQ